MNLLKMNYVKLLLLLVAIGVSFGPGDFALAADLMPEFSLEAVDGDGEIVSAEFTGKVVLVNFWATWCPPCRKEIASLIELHGKYASENFSVLGISVDKSSPHIIEKFARTMKINYPVALGPSSLAKSFGGGGGIPASFLVDQKGKVVKKYAGYVPLEKFESDVRRLIH